MRPFMIPCDFAGRKVPFPIYVGEPKPDNHPLQNQSWWLSSVRGGTIPQDVMDSFEKLHNISKEHNVSFEELCVYAMEEAAKSDQLPEDLAMGAPQVGNVPQMDGMDAGYQAGGGYVQQDISQEYQAAYQEPVYEAPIPVQHQQPVYREPLIIQRPLVAHNVMPTENTSAPLEPVPVYQQAAPVQRQSLIQQRPLTSQMSSGGVNNGQ